jgi:hypothetical protein
MMKIKRAPRGSHSIKQMNYNTLYKNFGREVVNEKELELEMKYPIAFGKAAEYKRAKILFSVLSGE